MTFRGHFNLRRINYRTMSIFQHLLLKHGPSNRLTLSHLNCCSGFALQFADLFLRPFLGQISKALKKKTTGLDLEIIYAGI